jgi:hypothetical protein
VTRASLKSCRKAAAHGRGALALLRAPVRARCLARHACSGASRTSQKRRPATCSARSRPALAAEARQDQQWRRRWPAVPTPRRAGPRADGAVASHRAADGAVPSIAAARTCARGTSRGAVARFARAWEAHQTTRIFEIAQPKCFLMGRSCRVVRRARRCDHVPMIFGRPGLCSAGVVRLVKSRHFLSEEVRVPALAFVLAFFQTLNAGAMFESYIGTHRRKRGTVFAAACARHPARRRGLEEQRALHVPGAAMRASSPLALPRR